MPESTETELYCPECGYDLRRLGSPRCPECGHEIDRTQLGQSVVPWVQRESVGAYRAFWKTVYLASFRPKFLAREMSRPARFGDAVKFRRLVVLHALVPMGIVATVLYVITLYESRLGTGYLHLWTSRDVPGSLVQLLSIPVLWVCIGLWLFAITGLASYFFHPGSLTVVRQNRAVALSYYACAPLAYMPLTLLLAVVGTLIGEAAVRAKLPIVFSGAIFLVAYVPATVQFGGVISASVILSEATTRLGSFRQAMLTLFMLVGWAVLTFLLLWVVPLAWAILMITLLSFRR
jgi:hypothetical protein